MNGASGIARNANIGRSTHAFTDFARRRAALAAFVSASGPSHAEDAYVIGVTARADRPASLDLCAGH